MLKLLCLVLPHQPISPATRANSIRFHCGRCGDVVPGALASKRLTLPLTVVVAPVRR